MGAGCAALTISYPCGLNLGHITAGATAQRGLWRSGCGILVHPPSHHRGGQFVTNGAHFGNASLAACGTAELLPIARRVNRAATCGIKTDATNGHWAGGQFRLRCDFKWFNVKMQCHCICRSGMRGADSHDDTCTANFGAVSQDAQRSANEKKPAGR
jgi:hypothetical protein